MAFLTLTTPLAAQMIGRAAYAQGTPLWEDAVVDEMQSSELGNIHEDES